jgi:hypothetical protein
MENPDLICAQGIPRHDDRVPARCPSRGRRSAGGSDHEDGGSEHHDHSGGRLIWHRRAPEEVQVPVGGSLPHLGGRPPCPWVPEIGVRSARPDASRLLGGAGISAPWRTRPPRHAGHSKISEWSGSVLRADTPGRSPESPHRVGVDQTTSCSALRSEGAELVRRIQAIGATVRFEFERSVGAHRSLLRDPGQWVDSEQHRVISGCTVEATGSVCQHEQECIQ